MRPAVTLRPTMPHHAAGSRTEPPVSVPMATGARPAATATPEPLDEPPGVRCTDRSHGFHGVPRCALVPTTSTGDSARASNARESSATPAQTGSTVLIDRRGGPRDGPPDPSSERGYAPLGLPRPSLGRAPAKPWRASGLTQNVSSLHHVVRPRADSRH